MRWILFVARLALICNICSLFTIIIMFESVTRNNAALSTVIVIGYVLAVIFNPLSNFLVLMVLLFRRDIFRLMPKWLLIANFIFLLLQIQYLFFLNDRIDN